MRMTRIWMILLVGGLVLPGAALAQSSDGEEQGASEKVIPSSSGEAALAESPDDGGQGRDYLAPGVHVWMGRVPSMAEIRQVRAQAKSLAPSVSDAPTFQNERVKIYMGKLPKPGGR
jgi:hypothetical protein